MPRTILRYAGGRELTLGDLGTREGLLGGINAVIVGNYLTTLGRDADEDLDAAGRAEDADQGTREDPLVARRTAVTAGSRSTRRPHATADGCCSSSRRATAPPAGAA